MSWRFWKKDEEPAAPLRDVDVLVTDDPASTAPGSPLPCLNEGDPLRVGDAVHLATTFASQPTRVRSIAVAGQPVEVLGPDQVGEVVLGDEADLSEVHRGSSLVAEETRPEDWPEGSFVGQVQRAEPRGDDALVVCRVAVGSTVRPGTRVTCSSSPGEEPPYVEVLAVEPAGSGKVGLVLGGVPSGRFRFGDEVVHVKLP